MGAGNAQALCGCADLRALTLVCCFNSPGSKKFPETKDTRFARDALLGSSRHACSARLMTCTVLEW